MLVLVVLLKQVTPKIAVKVPPYGMHMVGTVLCIVVFEEKILALDAVIMPFIRLMSAGPCKMEFLVAVDGLAAVDFINNLRAVFYGIV